MSIDPINSTLLQPLSLSIEHQQKSSVVQWMGERIFATNGALIQADEALASLASGQANHLHQTMLTLEEAKLSFQYMVQIRNRLMGAWQELLREQI